MSETVTTGGEAPAQTEAPAGNEAGAKGLPPSDITKAKPAAPVKLKIGDWEMEENQARSEIERGRQSGKLLTEAQKRLEASHRRDKEFETRKKAARSDFSKALEALEIPHEEAVELMSKYLYEREVLPQKMSPEQKRIRELENENKKFAEIRDSETKTKQKQEFDVQVQKEVAQLKQELEGIIKDKKIPGTRIALKRLAMYLKSYEESGVKVPAARAVDMLMGDYQQEFGELLDEASPDQLEAFLGKDRMQKLAKNVSKWALAKLKGSPKANDAVVKDITKGGGNKDEKLSPNDFTKFLGSLT